MDALVAVGGSARVPVPDGLEARLAHELIALHEPEAELCPPRARHRAYAVFENLPETVWETVSRLVFDSWSSLAPAARSLGTERLLRFESGVGALDLQLGRDPIDEALMIAVAVDGVGDRGEVHAIVQGDAGVTARITLNDDGTGSARLSALEGDVVVIVRDEDGEVLRTPSIPTV